jgi:hypothetical protein
MSMGDRSADRDSLDVLAEEFVARHRRGERPALAEYVEAYSKPSNLLLDACGIVWVADFGLAKAESGEGGRADSHR